jgi:hypothetical protein
MDIAIDLQKLELAIERTLSDFQHQADVNRLIQNLRALLVTAIEKAITAAVQQLLYDESFLETVKQIAARSAMRFKGFKPTSIQLLSGQAITIKSPYFAKAPPKARRGRKRKRKAKNGCHLALAYLGFIDRCSAVLASAAVQAALLCPSLEIAHRTLASFGIAMNVKTIRRLCLSLGDQALENRHRIALSDDDSVDKRIVFVCIDGGRLRERKAKRGRIPAKLQRRGYHTDWREPTQIVIQWLDADGNACKESVPLYDATMADVDGAFELLEDYLRQIDISEADGVIFCADGASKYWKRFSALAERLEVNACFEIIDYTHAKQNLKLVTDKLPKTLGDKKRTAVIKEWKNLLWQGNLAEIQRQIREFIKYPGKLKQALKKFNDYFMKNIRRMQYATFKLLNLPTGSGCVESAIRRVINLRLKSPGIFWKRETAEVMLFLRSTLLCSRWNIMLENMLRINRRQMEACP